MSFDPWISEWGNPPLMLGKSELSGGPPRNRGRADGSGFQALLKGIFT
jgi:hypothetical protein